MLNNFNKEEQCSLCHVLAEIVYACVNVRVSGLEAKMDILAKNIVLMLPF